MLIQRSEELLCYGKLPGEEFPSGIPNFLVICGQ